MKVSRKLSFINSSLLTVLSALLVSFSGISHAWVYSEHRDIAIQAVQYFDAKYKADFDQLWQNSRIGLEKKLCENAADIAQGLKTDCLDWAAFSAIGGDHSCSSKEMLNSILTESWLLDVANVSAQLKAELAVIPVDDFIGQNGQLLNSPETIADQIHKQKNRADRLNALRRADIHLLSADSQYVTRANSNTAHFLIARPTVDTTNLEYARLALDPGSEMNAIGVYAFYHVKALKKASRLAYESHLSLEQRQTITRSMLADEGFALHFLEDVFAAGHVAGTWGEVSQRMGTHNYYNAQGLEVFTWKREPFSNVLMGDAHMRKQDMELAAQTINTSLKQVLDFVAGRYTGHIQQYSLSNSDNSEDFNVCTQNQIPVLNDGYKFLPSLAEAIIQTPVPGLGTGLGSLPRFRSEVGPFIGLAGSLDGRMLDGGFFGFQDQNGYITGLDLSFRAGFGMDDVMAESGDGLVFLSLGFRSDSASSNKFDDSSESAQTGSISAAIPARSSISVRIRMPFYLIPTDLFWLSPLYFFNELAYTNMAVTAGNGGLIPWQNGIATSVGRFQFVLGREFGATFYDRNNSVQLIVPPDSPTGSLRLYTLKSILFDFPIIEYRPYRSFSSNQSSSVIFQLFASADVPRSNEPIIIQGVSQSPSTVWSMGIRMVFDWRHY